MGEFIGMVVSFGMLALVLAMIFAVFGIQKSAYSIHKELVDLNDKFDRLIQEGRR